MFWVMSSNPKEPKQGAEVLMSGKVELDSAGAELCSIMLSGPRFYCLLFASVTTTVLALLRYILYCLLFCISRGSKQWNCSHIFCSPSLASTIFPWVCAFLFFYFFLLNLDTLQVFPNIFRHPKWSFSVMLCKSPHWMNSRQCVFSAVPNCCQIIQQVFTCQWPGECFCHFPENFLIFFFSGVFSPFCLFVA